MSGSDLLAVCQETCRAAQLGERRTCGNTKCLTCVEVQPASLGLPRDSLGFLGIPMDS